MIKLFTPKFWFAGAIFFFFTATLQPELSAVYVSIGITLLILSGVLPGKKADLVMQER